MISLNDIAARKILPLEKLVRIEECIIGAGSMSQDKARAEMEWFINELGIDRYYFQTTSESEIAGHLIALGASELINAQGGGSGVQLISERPEKAVYIVEDTPERTLEIEQRIERKYTEFRLESYVTDNNRGPHPLRFYVVAVPDFPEAPSAGSPRDFESAAAASFLCRPVKETIARYKSVWTSMSSSEAPFISVSDKNESGETRIMIGMKGAGRSRTLTAFAHLSAIYGLRVTRKYVEPFADDKRILSLYFPKLGARIVDDLTRDMNVSLILPEGAVADLSAAGILSPQVSMYASAAAAFTHQFLSAKADDYLTLQRALKDQPEARGIVDNLKLNLAKYTYSTQRISSAVAAFPRVVDALFAHFRLRTEAGESAALCEQEQAVARLIETDVPKEKDRVILSYFLAFNNAVLESNFFRKDKSCAAFKVDPSIVDPFDFPERPFGLFFLIGRDFLGFHVRFRDIARGGIRIVRSRSADAYSRNIDTIFAENYNLALTQQRKNKDIPEGGSKGAILLNIGSQNAAERAFRDYVDGLLDLMTASGEILFLGPDEGTAGLMDWASAHARTRGYPFWKAFSTGKAPEAGGIPHDLYGMTTLGIHQYVLGVLARHGLPEEAVTKIQTGGPDGDLGSNEILISKDRTIAVVDGSGVLYDPAGLDRKELVRLAKKRSTVHEFDREKLGQGGFFVSVNEKDVQLPGGEIVANGEEFRNAFHLGPYAKADLFVPCGGRPGAISIGNWRRLLDDSGHPKFRFIVEGANLFIAESARLRLEESGVVVLKDASTNKGGVTSSSLEVLASLSLNDEEYDRSMRVEGGKIPAFRKEYVEETIAKIELNARAEFDLLWREFIETRSPLTLLSNEVSEKINRITDAVRESPLSDDEDVRRRVLESYAPKLLKDSPGMDAILERVPEAYLKAVVATKIAGDFVYGYGLRANEVDFADYINGLRQPAR